MRVTSNGCGFPSAPLKAAPSSVRAVTMRSRLRRYGAGAMDRAPAGSPATIVSAAIAATTNSTWWRSSADRTDIQPSGTVTGARSVCMGVPSPRGADLLRDQCDDVLGAAPRQRHARAAVAVAVD